MPPPPTSRGPRQLDHRAAAGAIAEGWGTTVTMGHVAASLGMAKPTLYRLAGSKEALVRTCVDVEAERLLDHLHRALTGPGGAPAPDPVAAVVRAVAGYAADSPGGFRLLFERRGPDADAAVARLEERLTDLLRGDTAGAGRPPRRLDVVAAALLGAAAAAVSRARTRS